MNKIAVCIPFWRRPEITSYVFSYYNNLKNELKDVIELVLIACGSEKEHSLRIANKHGFIYIDKPNYRFIEKHNIMYLEAKKYDVDACIKIDSDSIVSKEFFLFYNDLINDGYDYSGIIDIYFLVKNRLCYWSGYSNYRKGRPHGVGRFMSKKLLDMLNWMPFGNSEVPYPDKVLDAFIDNLDIKKKNIKCEDIFGICIDIKSNENLTPFEAFKFDKIIEVSGFGDIDNLLLNPLNIK